MSRQFRPDFFWNLCNKKSWDVSNLIRFHQNFINSSLFFSLGTIGATPATLNIHSKNWKGLINRVIFPTETLSINPKILNINIFQLFEKGCSGGFRIEVELFGKSNVLFQTRHMYQIRLKISDSQTNPFFSLLLYYITYTTIC